MSLSVYLQLALLAYTSLSIVLSKDQYLPVQMKVPPENEQLVPGVAIEDQSTPIRDLNGWSDSHSITNPQSVEKRGKVGFRKNNNKNPADKTKNIVTNADKKAKKAVNALKNSVKSKLKTR